MFPIRLVPHDTKIRFMERKWIFFSTSIVLILYSVFLLATKGLNYGIDFTGGVVIELRSEPALPLGNLRKALESTDFGEVSLQNAGNDKDILIRLQAQKGGSEAQQKAVETVKQLVAQTAQNAQIDFRKVDFVGPQVGDELRNAAMIAMIAALLGIVVYVWVQFNFQYGVGAICALFHDLIIMLGVFSFLGLEFNLTSVAAILTVLGYSINDSVVIFDRIRENLRKFKKKALNEVLNQSINETLSRTIMTSSMTIGCLIALVTLGGSVIYSFSLSVLIGIIIGTYSSVYIGAPILIFLKVRRDNPA